MYTVDALPLSIFDIIYQIVKDDVHPLTYNIKPRELILRSMQEWNSIHNALIILETEGLIATRQMDTLQILLTQKGLEWCQHKGH